MCVRVFQRCAEQLGDLFGNEVQVIFEYGKILGTYIDMKILVGFSLFLM